MLSIELLRLEETDPERLELISTVEYSARRGADMVTQVLSFARGVGGRRIEVAPGPLIHEIRKFSSETFVKSIEVRTSVPADLWSVSGDPTQLHQVLLNLCVNARDAMADGGTLTLSASNIVLDEHDAAREEGAAAGPYVVIDVADSGTGIVSGVMDRIFEPFFTTKELGRGTGLGLSTSLAIVKGHGGFMRVASAVGTGSTFRVYLPAAAAGGPDTSTSDTRDLPRGRRDLVLVIDDELAVREVTRRTLEAFGYRVLTAGDGAEGMVVFNEWRQDVAVVLIDMMMPVMDGPATIQALRETRPDIPVVAASGIGPHTASGGGSMPDVALFLQKPYSAEALLTSLSRVLRGEPGTPVT
jgi:CheY-like chemotaxis protein